MSRLEDAVARFSASLERLEANAADAAENAAERARKSAALESEILLLRDERDRLLARIAVLEDESRSLAGLTGEVEERLDGTIAEIREMLSRN